VVRAKGRNINCGLAILYLHPTLFTSNIHPYVTRIPLLVCNEWVQEMDRSMAQIIFLLIPPTSLF